MPDGRDTIPATRSAFQQLSRLMLRGQTTDTFLQAVVDATRTTLPGHVDASISVLIGNRPATAAHSGQLALDLDETQYERGNGPCLHAATTGEQVEIADARTETRWPDHTARAVERGSLSSLSVPLPMEGLRAGLNVYAIEARAIDEDLRTAAGEFARAAAVSIGNMHAYQTAKDIAHNLEMAVQSRTVIDQAKGILMERHQMTAEQAFQFLVHASQASDRELRDVADHLLTTGEVLQRSRRR